MAWQNPKTDWKAGDVPAASDFNRIEGNIQELENIKETSAGAQAKANTAEANAKAYTDAHEQKAAPHSGHETPAGAQAKAAAAAAAVQAELDEHLADTVPHPNYVPTVENIAQAQKIWKAIMRSHILAQAQRYMQDDVIIDAFEDTSGIDMNNTTFEYSSADKKLSGAFVSTADQSNTGTSWSSNRDVYGNRWCAQKFRAAKSGYLTAIKTNIWRAGSPNNLIIEIRNINNNVVGNTVYSTTEIPSLQVGTTVDKIHTFQMASPLAEVAKGQELALVFHQKDNGGSLSNGYKMRYQGEGSNNYSRGYMLTSSDAGASWSTVNSSLYFVTMVTPKEFVFVSTIENLEDNRSEAILTSLVDKWEGVDILYEVSLDGSTWQEIEPEVLLTGINAGSQFKLKITAMLNGSDMTDVTQSIYGYGIAFG